VRTVEKVFLASGAFILVSATIYWFVSYEWAGTILLVGTGTATLVVAAYTWLRVRSSTGFAEDRGDADPGDGEGEPITSFTMDSPWPLAFGIGVAVLAGGLVFGPPLLIVGVVVIVVAVVGMMRESIA
jgi:Cytochrome c oxidase subunit IV